MKILAFDCCFDAVSAAVRVRAQSGEWRGHEIIERRTTGAAERLFPMISEALEAAGAHIGEISRFAVTLGPGTFTGVRAGVAAARALALATAKPVVGASSLAAMAYWVRQHLPEPGASPMTVAVDARRGMIYIQHFLQDGSEAGGATLVTQDDVARTVSAVAGVTRVVVGSAAETVAAILRAQGLDARAHWTDLFPRAGSLAELAFDLAPLARVTPIYLRQPDAKEQAVQSMRVRPA